MMIGITLTLAALSRIAIAEDDGNPRDLIYFRQEIETLKGVEAAERKRVDQDEEHLQALENQLKHLESQNEKLGHTANTLEVNDSKLKNDTDQRLQQLQAQVDAKTSQ